MTAATERHPVDQIPPLRRLLPLGVQHVLAMYAGAVAVPLIIGGALGFTAQQLSYLISADLFVAGIATVIQSVGFWRFGVRLPLMQGVTFAAVTPMLTIGKDHDVTAIYGATIACGVLMVVLAPIFSKLLHLFPPIVTGTVILIIGLSLMSVAAGWITDQQDSASPKNVGIAAAVLLLVLLLERFAPPALARISVLLALVLGTLVCIPLSIASWPHLGSAGWFEIITPFHFGAPTFPPAAVFSMLIVGLVVMVETTGDMIAIGEITERRVTPRALADGLRADGLSTVIGGCFNTFPYTAFAQNVGLVSLTGVRSRFVATAAGVMLIVLGVIPKFSALVEGVPSAVLGGAGVALFGMVAASGVRTLAAVQFTNRNVLVVAISVGVGLLPTVKPEIYAQFPEWFRLIFDSGISAGAVVAIILNLVLSGVSKTPQDTMAIGPHDGVRNAAAPATETEGKAL